MTIGVMVNATEMAKPFGKLTADWLKTRQTKHFLKAFSDMKKVISADLVKIIKGGGGEQGTWMHEDVALEFARWLRWIFAK
ncbi:MAG: KilA-N domain-containing protein [Treponema sp.]|nr:KilA-N domain-containing protein [Treponema sp.]